MKAKTDDKLAFEKSWSTVNAAKYAGPLWSGKVSKNMGSLKGLKDLHWWIHTNLFFTSLLWQFGIH